MHEQLGRAGRHVRRGMLDLLYPPRCLECDARTTEAAPLCTSCISGLERAAPDQVHQRLQGLPEAQDTFETVFALWRFDPDGALRVLQHALKYGNRPRYGRAAGRWMGKGWREGFPSLPPLDAVVPVPLHRTRRLERGYNQSTQLAQGVAARLGVPCRADWLVRCQPTRSQTHLSRSARWENVADAFETPLPLHGNTLLLVDDVLTTGATVTAAAQTLRRAGAAHVHLATLALAE